MWYIVMFSFGLLIGWFSSAADIVRALSVLEPITLTALFASLLVPFAGFAETERWQKFVLQYGIIPLFGCYVVYLIRETTLLTLAIFAAAAGVHFAYWTSSIHSREYRARQFQLGYAAEHPEVARLVASLNVRGLCGQADEVIKRVICETERRGSERKEVS